MADPLEDQSLIPKAPHPNQRRSACERCRRQKLRCSRQNAANQARCQRCARLGFECIEGRQRKIGRPSRSDIAAAAAAAASSSASASASASTPSITHTSASTPDRTPSPQSRYAQTWHNVSPAGIPIHKIAHSCTPEPYNPIPPIGSLNVPSSKVSTHATNSPDVDILTTASHTNSPVNAFTGLLPNITSGLGSYDSHYSNSSTASTTPHTGAVTTDSHNIATTAAGHPPAAADLDMISEILELGDNIDMDPASWTQSTSIFHQLQPNQSAQRHKQSQPQPQAQHHQRHETVNMRGHQPHHQQYPQLQPQQSRRHHHQQQQQQQQHQHQQSRAFQSQIQMRTLTHQPTIPQAFLFPFPTSAYPTLNQSNPKPYPSDYAQFPGYDTPTTTPGAILPIRHGYTELLALFSGINTRFHGYLSLIQKYKQDMSIDLLLSMDSPLTTGSDPMIKKGIVAVQDFLNILVKLQRTLRGIVDLDIADEAKSNFPPKLRVPSPVLENVRRAVFEATNSLTLASSNNNNFATPKILDTPTSLAIISCYSQSLKFLEVITYHIIYTLDNTETQPLYNLPNVRTGEVSLGDALFRGTMFAQIIVNLIERLDELLGIPLKDPAIELPSCSHGMLNDAQLKMLWLELGESNANWSSRPQKLRKDLSYMKDILGQMLLAYSTSV
ncbi:hypothetical protein BROUX41_002895 [Berkeleyomyces rouxiae]|uniref:uncharacterized protein n=1 Tax=Berkeleyomyces rouxiae TaxID=2035830 RepID=UPI003B80E0BE